MIINSDFKPAWWLVNPHLQTIWGTLARRQTKVALRRERIELPDGDFVDIDWANPNNITQDSSTQAQTPLVLILHGLGGSINSHYAMPILQAINKQGWRAAFMHFRGASGVPNRLPRFYHSGDTADVDYVYNLLMDREPNTKIFAIGFSLGGNVLLKWLGEMNSKSKVAGAVAVSVPFELYKVAVRLEEGFSRIYQWRLLSDLRMAFIKKFTMITPPKYLKVNEISNCKTFLQFDTLLTAPLHGFKDAMDYYISASSRRYLKEIHSQTLILHASDDPFMTPDVIPTANELSSNVTLEVSNCGGHVGFVGGDIPGQAEYWLEKRIISFIGETLRVNNSVVLDTTIRSTT